MDPKIGNNFLQLLLKNQRRIYAFILGMVPVPQDADDLFQETVLILWSKFETTYEAGTSFSSWAVTIAKYHILNTRRKHHRHRRHLDPAVQALLMERIDPHVQQLDERVEALKNCVDKLGNHDSQLITMRYEEGMPIASIAKRIKRSIPAIYKRLGRVHDILQRCVQQTLISEGIR